jgi:hypothetical protein
LQKEAVLGIAKAFARDPDFEKEMNGSFQTTKAEKK